MYFLHLFSPKVWLTGGVDKNGIKSGSMIIEPASKRYPYAYGPNLPEPRMMHCLIALNDTHYFLHGGRRIISNFTGIKLKKNHVSSTFEIVMGVVEWDYKGFANQSLEKSYIFDWNRSRWSQV